MNDKNFGEVAIIVAVLFIIYSIFNKGVASTPTSPGVSFSSPSGGLKLNIGLPDLNVNPITIGG